MNSVTTSLMFVPSWFRRNPPAKQDDKKVVIFPKLPPRVEVLDIDIAALFREK